MLAVGFWEVYILCIARKVINKPMAFIQKLSDQCLLYYFIYQINKSTILNYFKMGHAYK